MFEFKKWLDLYTYTYLFMLIMNNSSSSKILKHDFRSGDLTAQKKY